MTAVAVSWVPSCRTPTEAYNAIKALSDALTAVGVVVTGDTGQIDLSGSTVTLPNSSASSNIIIGYQIRKMEAPGMPTLYLKFNYGFWASASASITDYTAARLTLSIVAGRTVNGAGTVSDTAASNLVIPNAAIGPSSTTSISLTRTFYLCSDGGNWLTFMNDPTFSAGANYPYLDFAIERTITASTGAYNAMGWITCAPGANDVRGFQTLPVAGTSYGSSSIPAQTPASPWVSSGALATGLVFPVTVILPEPQGPPIALLICFSADASPNTLQTVTMYGAARSYRVGNGLTITPGNMTVVSYRYMMRQT